MLKSMAGACALAFCTTAPVSARTAVDFSGFWEISSDRPRTPAAKLTSQGQAQAARMREERAKISGPVAPEARYCRKVGVPFIMSSSPPLDFVQGKSALAIIAEPSSQGRHIYLDGRDFPAEADFDYTSNGFSIGRWEGEVLVVETRYLTADRGIPFVPGGGFKTSQSRFVERIRLVDGGARLSITNTWTDPAVYAEPHTYEVIYNRMPAETYALENWCDAANPANSGLVQQPPQG